MDDDTKIWRYIDMEKFISLIVNETIYFPCAIKFQDPWEGYLPLSYQEKMTSLSKNLGLVVGI